MIIPVLIAVLLGLGGIASLWLALKYWLIYHHELKVISSLTISSPTIAMEQAPNKIKVFIICGLTMLAIAIVMVWQLRKKSQENDER